MGTIMNMRRFARNKKKMTQTINLNFKFKIVRCLKTSEGFSGLTMAELRPLRSVKKSSCKILQAPWQIHFASLPGRKCKAQGNLQHIQMQQLNSHGEIGFSDKDSHPAFGLPERCPSTLNSFLAMALLCINAS